ncbi:hypothetical protein AtubIFM57143_003216 [Aspergillus tubingensis]|nr:hypothetical protein AtubIFM57143_003216 [Aspergillus tubingensis]
MPSFSSTFSSIFKSSKKRNPTNKNSSDIVEMTSTSKASNKKITTTAASNGKNINNVNKNTSKSDNKIAKDNYNNMTNRSFDMADKSPKNSYYNNKISATTGTNATNYRNNIGNDYNKTDNNIATNDTEPVDLGIPRRGQYITRDGIDVVAVLETWHQIYTGWQIVSAELERKEKMRQRRRLYGQVTHYSSQIIDLEANKQSPSTENIPLSTYTTAPTQPCDTPWPGSTQGQTTAQEQTKALEQRPTPSYGKKPS